MLVFFLVNKNSYTIFAPKSFASKDPVAKGLNAIKLHEELQVTSNHSYSWKKKSTCLHLTAIIHPNTILHIHSIFPYEHSSSFTTRSTRKEFVGRYRSVVLSRTHVSTPLCTKRIHRQKSR